MPILKVRGAVEKYKVLSNYVNKDNLHWLNGRGPEKSKTKFRNYTIFDKIKNFGFKGETMVDVGCGDGSLLEIFSAHFDSLIGITPTIDECAAISRYKSSRNVSYKVSLSDNLDIKTESVDLLVCNNVLHGIGSCEKLFRDSLQEFSRVLKREGVLFLGELPCADEYKNRSYGTSVINYLIHLFKRTSPKFCARELNRMIISSFTKRPYILQPQNGFYCDVGRAILELRSAGMLIQFVDESDKNADGSKVKRYDYVTVKG